MMTLIIYSLLNVGVEYSTNLNFKFVSLFLIPAESETL